MTPSTDDDDDPSGVMLTITSSKNIEGLAARSTSQINVTVTPSGTPVTYTSSDTSIATVSSTGLITGVAQGSAIITVEAGGKRDTVNVTVRSSL